jgi:hypothetical protein
MTRNGRIRFGLYGLSAVWLLYAGLLGSACAKLRENQRSPGGASSQGGVAGLSGSGGLSGTGAFGAGGSTPIVIVDGGSAAEAGAAGAPSVGKDDACAIGSDTAEALPAVLELVVDTSGSMDWPPGWAPTSPDDSQPPGTTKWEITRDALLAAVESLRGDTALGANFYPNTSGDEGVPCLLNLVALPISLLGRVSSNVRSTWAAAVNDVQPDGATPTHGAYLFGLQQLAETDLPGNKFVLLITDGTPTCTMDCECTEDNLPVDSQPLIDETASALASGVRTFVIGSPGSEETLGVLSQVASEGGTGKPGCSDAGPVYCHFDMTTTTDFGAGLTQALEEIAASLRSCEYPIPSPPAGQMLERGLVNVLYTSGAGTTETIGRDPSERGCTEGWQYSDDGMSIVLCGEACAKVKDDAEGKVEVLFGCKTITAPEPR